MRNEARVMRSPALQKPSPSGESLRLLTTVGLVLAVLAILVAVTAFPVGDTLLWLVTLEFKSVTAPMVSGDRGSRDIC